MQPLIMFSFHGPIGLYTACHWPNTVTKTTEESAGFPLTGESSLPVFIKLLGLNTRNNKIVTEKRPVMEERNRYAIYQRQI